MSFQITGLVSQAGPMSRGDGTAVTKTNGDAVIMVEVGGRSGMTFFPSDGLPLPPVGQRIRGTIIVNSYRDDKGKWHNTPVLSDWE